MWGSNSGDSSRGPAAGPGGGWWDAALLWFLPTALRHAPTGVRRRAKLLVAVCIAIGAWGPAFVVLYWRLGFTQLAVCNAIATLAVAAPLVALRRRCSLLLAGNLAAADLAWILVFDAGVQGGLGAPAVTWFGGVPVIALLLAGARSGVAWGAIMLGTVGMLFGLDRLGVLPAPRLGADLAAMVRLVAVGGSVAVYWSLASLYESLSREALRSLEATNEALEAARDQAEAGARVKSEFLAMMSHEIRTPMTSVLGYADLLADPDLTAGERARCVDTIRRHGAHLLRIIGDILDLSKIEAGKFDVEHVECRLIELVEEVVRVHTPTALGKGLAFAVGYRGAVPDRVRTDPTRLRQILVNLIDNAIKFTERGGVRVVVATIPGEKTGDSCRVRFEVIDTGIGLTAEARGRLFTTFTQSDASMARKFGGTGLGLAISKRLAVMLGGEISVASAPGEGSTFALSIDLEPVPGARLVDDPGALPLVATASSRRAGVGVRLSGRILVAEDAPDTRRLIAVYLRKAGVEVVTTDNGLGACELVTAAAGAGTPFDLVLMDMQMPVLDGYAAAARLRAAGYHRPIVALTAHAMEGEREKCLGAGCDDFATKPIDREGLLQTIRRHLVPDAAAAGLANAPPLGEPELAWLVAGFVARLPARVALIERSLSDGDLETVIDLAHQLKGTAGGYGFPSISAAAAELEACGRARRAPDQIRERIRNVADVCRRTSAPSAWRGCGT